MLFPKKNIERLTNLRVILAHDTHIREVFQFFLLVNIILLIKKS